MAAYSDLGKNAKKILTEAYNGHEAKISVSHGLPGDCTVTTSTGLDTQTTEHTYAIDLATKLASRDKGVVIVDKRGINKEWVGSHSLSATVANLCDVKNLTFSVDSKGKINLAYKNNFLNESMDYIQETQTFKPTVCLSQGAVAAGVQTTISTLPGAQHGPKGTSTAVGYLGKTFQGHVHADNDGAKVGCSLWASVGKIEGAVEASHVLETSANLAEVGARYSIAPDFFVGAKINTNQNVGLCVKKGINQNSSVCASMSSLLNDISHPQIGAGVDFSHNFEFMSGLTSGMGGNKSQNNSARVKTMSLTADKHRRQRVGATPKELGENCTDEKCQPSKRYWE